MISMSFVPSKPKDIRDARISEWERQLNMSIGSRKIQQAGNESSTIQSAIRELGKYREIDKDAAVLWAVYRDLLGQTTKAEELTILAKSEARRHPAYLEVFSNKELTPERAAKLREELPETNAGRYAKLRVREKAGETVSWTSYRTKVILAGALMMAVVGAAMVGLVLLIAFVVLRRAGQFKPVGHPNLPITLGHADGFALRAFLLLLVPTMVAMVVPEIPGHSALSAIIGVALVLAMGRIPSLGYKMDRYRLQHSVTGAKMVGQGALIYMMGLPLIGLSMWLGPFLFSGLPAPAHPLTTAASEASLIALFGMFLLACVEAPIVEEICFRNSLMPALMKVTRSPWFGIILTNLLFAAIHPTGVPSWLTLATIGCVASFAVIQTGSIWTAVVVHAIHNSLTMMVVVLTSR